MSDSLITHEDLIAGLRGLRLPDSATGGLVADLAVAGAVGLLLGCALAWLVSLVYRRAPGPSTAPPLQTRLDVLRHLPESERAIALLHLLRDRDPGAVAALRDRLYRRGVALDVAELEARVRRDA